MDFQDLALTAIRTGKRVSLSYHGEDRLVEVHALGVSTAGNPCVRVFQVIGGSVFSETTGWKMMKLSDIENARLVDDASLAPRQGYQPGDRGMSTIIAEVRNE